MIHPQGFELPISRINYYCIEVRLICFLFLRENICCEYSLEAPRRGASNEYPQHMFSWRNKRKYQYNSVENEPNIWSYAYFSIRKTCLYHFDPLKPHFYIVKLGFTGVYIIFLIFDQKHKFWVLVRTATPRRF